MTMGFGRGMLEHWTIDSDTTYLNHGTVGVVPRRVLAAQQAIRDEMERQPARFMLRQVSHLVGAPTDEPTLVRRAAGAVASFLGADGDDLVFVDNATSGANAVLRSIPFQAGDEILLTDHNYGATARVAAFVARERGAVVRTVAVPYPHFDRQRLVEAVEGAIGPRTRVAVLDHITSESALVFPLADLARRCRERGVAVLADGAHAPGTLPIDLPTFGVDWYVGNLHKWAYAPRSCGILWARPDRQAGLHPPVVSWGLDQGFLAEFDWVGTRDPSPWLAAPVGLGLLQELDFDAVRQYNHDLAWRACQELTDRWGGVVERDEESVGSMVTVPLPKTLGCTPELASRLRDSLLDDDHIEIQVHARDGQMWVRVSAQVYNDWSDIERLSGAIERRLRT
jgi:isopenicillin-N epimerase